MTLIFQYQKQNDGPVGEELGQRYIIFKHLTDATRGLDLVRYL